MARTRQNQDDLRATLGLIMGDQKDRYTGGTIPELLDRLGLEDCPDATSKRNRLRGAVSASSDDQITEAAQKALVVLQLQHPERCELQELIWAGTPHPDIPARFRREVALQLGDIELCLDRRGFDESLGEFWRVDEFEFLSFSFTETSPTLRDKITCHYIDNNDWNVVTLFDQLGAFQASSARFAYFLEALASSRVRPDEEAQRKFIDLVNSALQPCGVRFVEAWGDDGYLDPSLASIGSGEQRSPKNLIFASSTKPDLRFSNALDNDIEIVSNADQVLVFDRPINKSGLLWKDLQAWWADTQNLNNEKAKRDLYKRLRASLPKNSPPQTLAFETFYKTFSADVQNLPALLPEVWFHWDPQTVAQRGKAALLRFRMDFLLLLPGGIRVVIEIDGKHHYSTDDGRANPKSYSDMMAADRALRLTGYEVYRFGTYELLQPGAEDRLAEFYRTLFARYRILHAKNAPS